MHNDEIKELALANGFKLKEQPDGSMDLNPYVYQFARALLSEATQHTIRNISGLLEYISDFGPDADPKVVDSECYEIKHRMSGEYYEPERCGNCRKCLDGVTDSGGWPVAMTRMIVCSVCGNKRCPKASNHALDCTGSNEPGDANEEHF